MAKIFEELKKFALSESHSKQFKELNEDERKYIHNLAGKYGFKHLTEHKENEKGEICDSCVVVEKIHKKGEIIPTPKPEDIGEKKKTFVI